MSHREENSGQTCVSSLEGYLGVLWRFCGESLVALCAHMPDFGVKDFHHAPAIRGI